MQLTVHCHPFLTVPEATSRPLVLRQVRCFVIMSSDSVTAHSSNQFWTWLISSLSGFCICRFFTFCILKISYCLCKDVRLLFFFCQFDSLITTKCPAFYWVMLLASQFTLPEMRRATPAPCGECLPGDFFHPLSFSNNLCFYI